MTAVRDAVTELQVLASGLDHPEAVAWWGGAVWCGTESGDLLRIDPATGATSVVAATGGFLLGLAFDADGRCYACDSKLGRVLRISQDGAVESVADSAGGRKLACPNYLLFSSGGTLYVTDSGPGWEADDGFLLRIPPGGQPEIVSEECLRFPNGLALSADERTLYVVESRLPGVVTYDLGAGAVGPRREFRAASRDGARRAGPGCQRSPLRILLAARPRLPHPGGGGAPEIYLDDPTAEYLNSPTNLCFGGADLRTLYLAGLCGWNISQLAADVPGQPLARPALPRSEEPSC